MFTYLLEGADRVAGQLRGDKECPFSGVTKSGRVWRKVPESDARSVWDLKTLLPHPANRRWPEDKKGKGQEEPVKMYYRL